MQFFMVEFRFKKDKKMYKKQAQTLVDTELKAKSEIFHDLHLEINSQSMTVKRLFWMFSVSSLDKILWRAIIKL